MSPDPETLAATVAGFPEAPGVYLMKDERGHVIYVGKAKNLKNRVRQYLAAHDSRYQVAFLMRRVREIAFIRTDTESEALLLENSLIKKHKPRYNVFLKDDKTYLGLKLTLAHDFPRLVETRRIAKDGAAYYGPFTSAEGLRDVKEFIYRHFLLRTCGDGEFASRTRPCLEYQIKRCSAPCVGYVTNEDYAEQIRRVNLFLDGKSRDLLNLAAERRDRAAARLDFEEAARQRDLGRHMNTLLQKQKVTRLTFDFMDVIALARSGDRIGVAVLMIREGDIFDSRYYVLKGLEDDAEAIENFMAQYYAEDAFMPREIIVPDGSDAESLSETLSKRAGFRVTVRTGRRGERRCLMGLARRNLTSHMALDSRREDNRDAILENLRARLNLPSPPLRIECFDTSHVSGTNAVAARVVFVDGEPFKDGYRRYRSRAVPANNDYAFMREALGRRFSPSSGAVEPPPDLLLVDGGKGHLGMALRVMEELNITGVGTAAIAKGRGPGARARGRWPGKKEDEVYVPGRKNPVVFRTGSPELSLLQRVRDEAHRFAVAYHRKRRERDLNRSWLDDVEGVGPVRKSALLRAFGSPSRIAKAAVEELCVVPGVTRGVAERIKRT